MFQKCEEKGSQKGKGGVGDGGEGEGEGDPKIFIARARLARNDLATSLLGYWRSHSFFVLCELANRREL
jgi:hypothetical protein